MKPQYGVIIALGALFLGYVAGIAYGRQDEGDSWRSAVLSVESDACRTMVRDALGRGGFMGEER